MRIWANCGELRFLAGCHLYLSYTFSYLPHTEHACREVVLASATKLVGIIQCAHVEMVFASEAAVTADAYPVFVCAVCRLFLPDCVALSLSRVPCVPMSASCTRRACICRLICARGNEITLDQNRAIHTLAESLDIHINIYSIHTGTHKNVFERTGTDGPNGPNGRPTDDDDVDDGGGGVERKAERLHINNLLSRKGAI